MTDWIILIRLLLATLLGGLLGYEREQGKKAAGLRTHILVSLGSTLIMLVSIYVAEKAGPHADPSRIAAQVVTGIGFLGAGAILRSEKGGISGLTTAASIWVAAAIGLAIGCGFLWAAFFTSVIALVALRLLGSISKPLNLP